MCVLVSDSPKGRRLYELVDDLGLTLLNKPASHTRIGQGVCRDTTPDLSMTVEEQTSINRKVRIVEWDKFRKNRDRKNRDREKEEGPIEDIGAWCKEILADVEKGTKEIKWADWREKEAQGGEGAEAPRPRKSGQLSNAPPPSQKVDARKVSKQEFNKKLRKKITEIYHEIETHCSRLCEQEWQELCNTMDGNMKKMSAGRTWKILKHLLHPASTRTAVRTEMAKLRHKYTEDLEALADEVMRTHLTRPGSLEHPTVNMSETPFRFWVHLFLGFFVWDSLTGTAQVLVIPAANDGGIYPLNRMTEPLFRCEATETFCVSWPRMTAVLLFPAT
ncbi:hypothetical protein MTO96_021367 [Rhipicephalus appendiculatus]